MPAFAKNPKVIGTTIVVIWLAFVIYKNLDATFKIYLLPFESAGLEFKASMVMIASAIFGAIVTLIVQFMWRRRASKNGSRSAAASSSSSTFA